MNLTFDFSDLKRKVIDPLQGSERRVRANVAGALTVTAKSINAAERREMIDSFDRPNNFTLNSGFVSPATAARPEALVGIKNDSSEGRAAIAWLRWQIRGGLRTLTAFEKQLVRAGAMDGGDRAVPARFARLDAFGNISRGQLQQILSQLRIGTGLLGSTRTLPRITAADSAMEQRLKGGVVRRAYQRAGGQFVAFPYGRGRLRPGIYLIRQFNAGRADPKPVIVFVSKAQYEQRFDFFGVAERVIRRELPGAVSAAVTRSLLNAQAGPGQTWNRA